MAGALLPSFPYQLCCGLKTLLRKKTPQAGMGGGWPKYEYLPLVLLRSYLKVHRHRRRQKTYCRLGH